LFATANEKKADEGRPAYPANVRIRLNRHLCYQPHETHPVNDSWRRQYPFRSNYLEIGGERLHYLDEGPTDGTATETLLCVHGNPTWSYYWRHFAAAWRGKYRVVVPDHIGCGLSDKPQDYEYRLGTHVGNLRKLIHHLDLQRVTLLVHDWGGAIGLGAAGLEPERFSRLVVFNTAAFLSDRCPWRIRVCRTPVVGAWGVRGLNLFARAALSMATAKPERFTPEVCAGYLAPYDSYANRVAIQRFVEDIPLSKSHPSYQSLLNIERRLADLAHLPTTFIWGMRDWCFTPHFLERFEQFFPRAEVHRFDDAGHYVVEDAHERIVPIVEDFIARHPAALSEAKP
jgi:pimeloyl-ACP methyl ester carboxylesterase